MRSITAQVPVDTVSKWLRGALNLADEDTLFPWQEEFFTRLTKGAIERSLDIPTGLGKTAVMALWLVARACGAALPRRLAYVVDRRAVVDQATEVAIGLRDLVDSDVDLRRALGLTDRSLPISTLRGQHVDNREWLEDPASPAIIVGTVDMIGSRLLFEGYRTTRKMRPYHAGLLGSDTLVVLDEAHLVPPFEKLLETIADGGTIFGPRDEDLGVLLPPFKLLTLTATGRALPSKAFALQDADLKHEVVIRRLTAPKRVRRYPLENGISLQDALADQAWRLTESGKSAVRCIVFCDQRKVAEATKKAIENLAKGNKKLGIASVGVDTDLLVGGRRVFEREEAAKRLKALGFIAGTQIERVRPAFLFATSAGEVGVDLDADHMVSDLVAWERMVQRLGRVNRRGNGEADVIVVIEPEPKPRKLVQDALKKAPAKRTTRQSAAVAAYRASTKRTRALKELLRRLPNKNGAADASPGALRALKSSAEADPDLQALLDDATTPAPLRPALSRALADAWAMTSLRKHSGRPEIAPWLRGWAENEPPRTALIWRTHLPVRVGNTASDAESEAFLKAAPPHTSEVLETETYRVVQWLDARTRALAAVSDGQARPESEAGESAMPAPLCGGDVAAFDLTSGGDLRKTLRLEDLTNPRDDKLGSKRKKAELERELAGATLVVDSRIGGLKDGLLDHAANHQPRTVDDGGPWISAAGAESGESPAVRFRVRTAQAGQDPARDSHWRERLRFATELSGDLEPICFLIVEKWRHDAATEEDRSAGRPQLLKEHLEWVAARARSLAHRLGLPRDYAEMLAIAARLHDEGKRATCWQRAFNAENDGVYAKTRGPLNTALLNHYRHEFGSLPFAALDEALAKLPNDLQDLALHLIASHHGFARPIISTDGCEDMPPSALKERAREVALRFARLQRRWGPWGLAWWEALLRAADQQASRDNDAVDSSAAKKEDD